MIPSRYDLDLIVELDPVWEIDGFFSVKAEVTPTGDAESDNRVTLNSDGITIDEETVMVLVPTTKLWNRTIVHPFHMRERIIFIYRRQIDHYSGLIWKFTNKIGGSEINLVPGPGRLRHPSGGVRLLLRL